MILFYKLQKEGGEPSYVRLKRPWIERSSAPKFSYLPPIGQHLIFEKSSWTNLIFVLHISNLILQATQAVKIKFEIDQKSSSSNLIFQKSSADQ